MKHSFLILLLSLLFSHCLLAQDTIIKKSGIVIIAKIVELTPTEIKYKRYNLSDNIIITINKSEIKRLVYSNGLKEVPSVEKQAHKTRTPRPLPPKPPQMVFDKNKLYLYNAHFIYEGMPIRNDEFYFVLMNTNDKEIMTLADKSMKAKRRQYLCFGAIPSAIVAVGFLGVSIGYGDEINSAQINGKRVPPSKSQTVTENSYLLATLFFCKCYHFFPCYVGHCTSH